MQLFRDNVVLEVNGTDTFKNLEKMLEEKGYCLSNWYISLESKIDPNSQRSKVLVRFPNGKTIVLDFRDFVSESRHQIYSAEGIAPYDQLLFFAGMFLENEFTLSHHKFSPGFTIDAAVQFCGFLKIETISGETIYMDHLVYKTVREVKELVQKQTGIPTCHQRLVNVEPGEEVVDTRIFGSYLIREGAILRFVDDLWTTNEMKIYVKVVATGDNLELDVVSCDTISNVKNMIEKKVKDYPAGQQLLYLPQKRLEDTFTLADYYILDQDTLRLVRIFKGKEEIPQDRQQLSNEEGNPSKRQKQSTLQLD